MTDIHTNTGGIKSGEIKKIDICYSIETNDLIIGAVIISTIKSAGDSAAGKIFIYKCVTPMFIELIFDESYINYLFSEPVSASRDIADYTLRMLGLDFPGSMLNMSTCNDIGLVQLPKSFYSNDR